MAEWAEACAPRGGGPGLLTGAIGLPGSSHGDPKPYKGVIAPERQRVASDTCI